MNTREIQYIVDNGIPAEVVQGFMQQVEHYPTATKIVMEYGSMFSARVYDSADDIIDLLFLN